MDSCAASRVATACPPSRRRRCCLAASKSGRTSRRRCTPVLNRCWPDIARHKACCPNSRPNQNPSEITAAANGPDQAVGCLSREGVYEFAPMGPRDGVVTQRSAKQTGNRIVSRKRSEKSTPLPGFCPCFESALSPRRWIKGRLARPPRAESMGLVWCFPFLPSSLLFHVKFEPALFAAGGRLAFEGPGDVAVFVKWGQRLERFELEGFFDRESV